MVSVIIPVYNVEKYLPECIESVCRQTLSDLEIILVDDGSTDRSGDICEAYAKRDSRIVAIHKENGGHTSARNAGLKIARGEYIGFVDSDDWIEPAMYMDMLSACERENADAAVQSSVFFEYGNRTKIETRHHLEGIYRSEDDSINKLLRNLIYAEDRSKSGAPPALWNYLFRKDLVSKHQFKVDRRIKYGEDAACTYPCLISANKVVVIDGAYYHHREHGGSICHSTDKRYFERITVLYQQLKSAFMEHPSSEILMEQLNRYMLDLVIHGVNTMFGFGYGIVVPPSFPPDEILRERGMKRIVLYGAGGVGQSYSRWYQMTRSAEIVAWVDRQWEEYKQKGSPVEPVSKIADLEYDGVLIAVLDGDTAAEIKKTLKGYGVADEKIVYERPQNILQSIEGKEHK